MGYNMYMFQTIELLKVIAWPITLLIIVWVFAKEIKELINDIRLSFTFGDKKVEIAHDKAEELKQQQTDVDASEIEKLRTENKKHSDIEKRLLELQENTARTKDTFFIGFHFEKTYRLIFGSQLMILKLMYQHNKMLDVLTRAIYGNTSWANTYPYNQYIGFLINSGLITPLDSNDNSYSILPVGRAFIDYLSNNNIPLDKQPF